MAKERLSKLQKWILTKCLEGKRIHRSVVMEFYGKKYLPGYKDKELSWDIDKADKHMLEERQEERRKFDYKQWKYTDETYIHKYHVVKDQYISTKAEEVIISRTLKNLKNKCLLEQINKWGDYHLTEKGFLIAKNCVTDGTFINYKEYKEAIDQIIAEEERRHQAFVNSFKKPSEEYEKKRLELKAKLKDYESKFNVYSVINICCSECKVEIEKFQNKSGIEEVKKIKEELDSLR